MPKARTPIDLDALGLPAAFTTATAAASGLTRRLQDRMVSEGQLERLARGLLDRPDLTQEADWDLLEAALRAPDTIICLTSALARHDLTDEIPAALDLALPRGRYEPVRPSVARWHAYYPDTFAIGRTELPVAPGISLGLYSPERSVVDAFNPRMRLGHEIAVEALRRWLERRESQPSALLEMAKAWPHAQVRLLHALQVLL